MDVGGYFRKSPGFGLKDKKAKDPFTMSGSFLLADWQLLGGTGMLAAFAVTGDGQPLSPKHFKKVRLRNTGRHDQSKVRPRVDSGSTTARL